MNQSPSEDESVLAAFESLRSFRDTFRPKCVYMYQVGWTSLSADSRPTIPTSKPHRAVAIIKADICTSSHPLDKVIMALRLAYAAIMSLLIWLYRSYCPELVAYFTSGTGVDCQAFCTQWGPTIRSWVDRVLPTLLCEIDVAEFIAPVY